MMPKIALSLWCFWLAIAPLQSRACPLVGAIRWDAWFGRMGAPGDAVEATLAPEQFHDRLPLCARVRETGVAIDCMTPGQMQREIDQAKIARLNYWAFVTYPDDDPMSLGLRLYLANKTKDKVRFALVTELSRWGTSSDHDAVIDRFARFTADRAYQRTADGRPLFFLGFVSDEELLKRYSSRAEFRKALDVFRGRVREKSGADPFIVLLEPNVSRARGLMRDLGADAVSAYSIADPKISAGTYPQLTETVMRYWTAVESEALPLVPLAMTGWDRRPRVLHPVPWEHGVGTSDGMRHYYGRPSKAQLRAHVADALRHAESGASGALNPGIVLIYAWNEFDEGGWLEPTRGDGTWRLEAVREARTAVCR